MKLLRKLLSQTYNEIVVSEPTQEEQDQLTLKIHNEIDSLEQHYIEEVTELLNTLQIPTTDKVTQKADLMESLGFSKANETVKQGSKLKEEIKEVQIKTRTNKERLNLINEYRLAYPNDKIIPMEEFEKVINKYNLIYAPSSAYIKDVPEKNLLEIKNSKMTIPYHSAVARHVVTKVSLGWSAPPSAQNWDFSNIIIKPNKRYKESSLRVSDSSRDLWDYVQPYSFSGTDEVVKAVSNRMKLSESFVKEHIRSVDTKPVERSGLFISAPKSHFDLTNLSKDGREYYEKQKVKVTVTKDPIAFYLLRGEENDVNREFVRIVSKWGTSDDQSFLDPIIQDERNN